MNELQRAARGHFERGNALDENGDRSRAIAEWLEAVHLDPDLAAAHYNLGIAFAERGESQIAEEQLRLAIGIDPFDIEARLELVRNYLDEEQTEAAINQLRQILNIAPGDGEAARLLAELYLDQGRVDESVGALESGGMVEEDADLWVELGRVYEAERRFEDAILAYRRALVCRPGYTPAEQGLVGLDAPTDEPPAPDEK